MQDFFLLNGVVEDVIVDCNVFTQATMLPSEFKAGKLHAFKLICEMMTKHQDVLPNSDFLVHLYHVMHKGFTNDDQVPIS